MGPEQMMGWHWGGMWIFPLMFFAVIAFCVFMMSGRCRFNRPKHHEDAGKTEDALDILKKRYAKGEITKDEFEQMKKDILS